MEIDVRVSTARATVVLVGPLTDDQGIQALRDTISDLLQRGVKEIVLDLEGVPYIDSARLGEIVKLYTAVSRQGGSLKPNNLTKRITKLLSFKR